MKQLSRVVWNEGMHLAQHHFQAQSRYFEDAIQFALSSLFFAPYGLRLVEPIEASSRRRLARQIDDLRSMRLHAKRELVGGNPRREFRILLARGQRLAIELVDQIDRRQLLLTADSLRRVQIQNR